MASANSKNRTKNRLWKLIREVGGSEVEIERDPLHQRYEVNRYGMQVNGPSEMMGDVHDRLLALLVIHGYTVTHDKHWTKTQGREDEAPALIHKPFELPYGGESRISISIN